MVDQQPDSDAASAVTSSFADAIRELAFAVGDLASAVRDSAAIVELVPCEEGECGEHGEQPGAVPPVRGPDSATVLPLIPTQDRTEPTVETLCRPGGCACTDTERAGQGRHARREAPPVPAGSTADDSADSSTAFAVVAAVSSDAGCHSAAPTDCSTANLCDGAVGI